MLILLQKTKGSLCIQYTVYIYRYVCVRAYINLDETFQSAYKAFHSTETALVRVHNDILTTIDNNNTVILLLLPLSAAFDTVDHSILSRLSSRFGIKGIVLAWLRSYLTSRKQFVNVNKS